ncbi:hypothetical protein [uncultured Rikenella sp.]|uniref:hypothetical protein n=1 Tax=uncultured Rikenella sp. TaxID=368003 RepID=UPI002631286F|nr:hypothetical protein [uncultured Rikenella sp.]
MTRSRATPKEGNRQNVLARFDKISPGARKNSTLYEKTVARPLKEGFHSFCGEQNRDEIPAGDDKRGGAIAEPQ